jgi:hypothetical protein
MRTVAGFFPIGRLLGRLARLTEEALRLRGELLDGDRPGAGDDAGHDDRGVLEQVAEDGAAPPRSPSRTRAPEPALRESPRRAPGPSARDARVAGGCFSSHARPAMSRLPGSPAAARRSRRPAGAATADRSGGRAVPAWTCASEGKPRSKKPLASSRAPTAPPPTLSGVVARGIPDDALGLRHMRPRRARSSDAPDCPRAMWPW